MMIGALGIGTLTDVIGRRKAILISVVVFSVFTGLCALAPSPAIFGALRFLAGLGLGGLIPTAAALVSEYAHLRRGSSSITFMMTGYHVGGVLTALLAIPILPSLGWRTRFIIGALPALVLVPLMLRNLQESPSFLVARGRRAEAEELAARHGIILQPEEVRGGQGGGERRRRGQVQRSRPSSPAGTSSARSPSPSLRSWGCSSSTGSTSGCRRSCATPATLWGRPSPSCWF
jgi:MFS family permease